MADEPDLGFVETMQSDPVIQELFEGLVECFSRATSNPKLRYEILVTTYRILLEKPALSKPDPPTPEQINILLLTLAGQMYYDQVPSNAEIERMRSEMLVLRTENDSLRDALRDIRSTLAQR